MANITTNPSTIPSVIVVNNHAVTTSNAVAEFFGKRHDNVLRAIENLKADCGTEYYALNFEETFQTVAMPNNATKRTPIIQMTKDGFTLLVMGFTGKQAMQFKIAYINRFNEMETALHNPLAITNGQHYVVAKDGVVIYHKVLSDRTAKGYLQPALPPVDTLAKLKTDLGYFLAPENPRLEMNYCQAQDALTCLSTVVNILERNGLQLGLMYQQTQFVSKLLSSYWTRLDELSSHLISIRRMASVQQYPSVVTMQGVRFS